MFIKRSKFITIVLLASLAIQALAEQPKHLFVFHVSSYTDQWKKSHYQNYSQTPDKKLTCKLVADGAKIVDVASGKAITPDLKPGPSMRFTCFTFTPDGKYLAFGLAYKASQDDTSVGAIQVFDVVSGKKVDEFASNWNWDGESFGDAKAIAVAEKGTEFIAAVNGFRLDGK